MNKQTVPVLMFHSVGTETYNWSRYLLSVNLTHFEKFCEYLQKNSYKTLFLNEWYDLQNNSYLSKDKIIVLTFDDGYLDNCVFAYPLLKKYNLKGTIFVNPEFVDEKNTIQRPKYGEKGFDKSNVKNILGFLNWNEITEMENSGVIDIQNHSMTHNKYFSGPHLRDFLTIGTSGKYDWLLWNIKPELKPHYMHTNIFDYLDEGYPVLENERALVIKRFFPDENLMELIISRYQQLKNEKHIDSKELNSKMRLEYAALLDSGKYPGRYESDEEMLDRFKYELEESKNIFKARLNKTTDFLCWPGGGNNELSLKLSKTLGYKASTFNEREKGKVFNSKDEYKRIARMGMGSFVHTNSKSHLSNNKSHLIMQYLAQNGNQYHKFLLKSKKLFFLIK